MEVQSARKARPSGGGLIPVKTPPERDLPEEQADDPAPVAEPEPELAEQAETPPAEEPVENPTGDEEQVPHLARVPQDVPTPAQEPEDGQGDEEAESEPQPREAAGGKGVLFTTESPVLSVQATGPRTVRIGQGAQFAVKIKNAGAPATNVIVMVDLPPYVEVSVAHATSGTVPTRAPDQANGPLEWKLTRLESRTIETLNLTLIPRKSAPVDLGVRYTYAPEASQMTVEVQEPKLEMSITGPDDVAYGQTKVYKLTLSNPGNGDTENVVIGLLPVGRSTDGVTSHRLGTLRAGESKSINVELTARQAGSVSIRAQAYADGGLRTEAAQQVLVRRANLQVNIEAPKLTYAGTVGMYQIKVVNTGNSTAENVQVAAMLPPDAKYIGSNSGGRFEPQQGRIVWSVGSLPTGGERTLDVQCSLNTPGDNRLQFVATADEDLNAAATANTQVQALADLKIEVRDPQGPVAVGQDSVYEVVVRNRGSAAAENVDLTVFFSEGLEAKSVEGAPHEIATGQVIFKPIPSVGAGETLIVKVHTLADRAGNHIFRAELVCQSLDTKLAAEEATLYYGDGAPAVGGTASEPTAQAEPTPAAEPAELPQQAAEPATDQPAPVAESDDPPPAP
jgi:uncharacterized repeat protein (TIGR01451 family)